MRAEPGDGTETDRDIHPPKQLPEQRSALALPIEWPLSQYRQANRTSRLSRGSALFGHIWGSFLLSSTETIESIKFVTVWDVEDVAGTEFLFKGIDSGVSTGGILSEFGPFRP